MKYSTTLQQFGNNTGIEVPPEVIEALGGGKRPAVQVTVNGDYAFTSTPGIMRGKTLISFSAARRAETGLAGGDAIEVDLELDTAPPPEFAAPPELQAELDADGDLAAAWAALAKSRRQRIALPISHSKTDPTRDRNVAKAVTALRDGTA